MFPDNQFWQCPSYTWSSFVLSSIICLIIGLMFLTAGPKAAMTTSKILSMFMLFWMFRTLYHFVSPNKDCEAKGYIGQSYINPFASKPAAY